MKQLSSDEHKITHQEQRDMRSYTVGNRTWGKYEATTIPRLDKRTLNCEIWKVLSKQFSQQSIKLKKGWWKWEETQRYFN
eukprot:snap_masked-scaffold_7-processed-gene-2.43-mRNA-1 protein AED:1.00 eAED:1.00 QI:0/-1/0/0/-1/1/1/0/79